MKDTDSTPIEVEFLKATIYPIAFVVAILFAICLILVLTKPKLVRTEYFDDSSAVVVKCNSIAKGTDQVEVTTECGNQTVTSDEYYSYYLDRTGSKVTAKFEKSYYEDGTTFLRIYKLIPNED